MDWMMTDNLRQGEMLREFHTQPKARDAVQDLARSLEVLAKELAGRQKAAHGNAASFSVFLEGTPRELHPILWDAVNRIAGEALRNAFRHARAQQIEVEIRYDPRHLRVRVRDDGVGIDAGVLREKRRAERCGLSGMRDRAKRIGGQLEIWTRHGAGTEVELTVPKVGPAILSPDISRAGGS